MDRDGLIKAASDARADGRQVADNLLSEATQSIYGCRVRSSSAVPGYESRFELLVEESDTPIVRLDRAGAVVFANGNARKLLSDPGTEIQQQLSDLVVLPTKRPSEQATSHPDHLNELQNTKTGQRFIALRHDLTGSDTATFTLVSLESDPSTADSIFVETAHEIRSPLIALHAILSNTLIDLSHSSETSTLDGIKKAVQQSEAVLRVADNMLELRQAQAGDVQLRLEHTALHQLIEELIDDWTLMGAVESDRLTVNLESTYASVDRMRVRQVLENLLSNAVKFSDEGSEILIECWPTEQHAIIEVRDRGVGVANVDSDDIFTPFFRVDSSSKAGHGLGLAISRTICRLHGGDLDYVPRDGGGSSFVAHLPAQPK